MFKYSFESVKHQPLLDMVIRSDDHRVNVGDEYGRIDIKDIEENMYSSNKKLLIYILHKGELYSWRQG